MGDKRGLRLYSLDKQHKGDPPDPLLMQLVSVRATEVTEAPRHSAVVTLTGVTDSDH